MKATLLTLSLVLTIGLARADVVGTFDVNGSTVTASPGVTTLDCTLPSTLIPGSCPTNSGNGLIDNATGDMTPFFVEGVFIQSPNFPLNMPIDVTNWLTITPSIFNSTSPTITFDLTFLPLGVFSPVDCGASPMSGQTCTPPGSNFNLENTQTGFTASFDVMGVTHFSDGTDGTFNGTFTSTVNGESYQDALATVLSGGSVTETYAASFTVFNAVPEPPFIVAFLLILPSIFVIKRFRSS